MAAIVIFESIYGSTREVANAVAAGLGENTVVAAVSDIDEAALSEPLASGAGVVRACSR